MIDVEIFEERDLFAERSFWNMAYVCCTFDCFTSRCLATKREYLWRCNYAAGNNSCAARGIIIVFIKIVGGL